MYAGLLLLVFGLAETQFVQPLLPGTGSSITSSQCHLKPADIIFVLDDSGSVGLNNFRKELQFVQEFARQFDIGPLNVQIGVIIFSTSSHEYISLNTYRDSQSLIAAIGRLPYQSGGTNTADALRHALNPGFTQQHGDRDSVSNVLMVITDGQSQNKYATANVARQVHNAGIKTFAIGVGGRASQIELKHIASDPKHVFHVKNYDALQTLKDELRNQTCEAIAYSNLYCQNNIKNCMSYGHVVCVNYAQWARQNCPLYCGYCAAQGTPPLPTSIMTPTTTTRTTSTSTTTMSPTTSTNAPTPPPLQFTVCRDEFGSCNAYGSSVCTNYREWSIKNCAQFCQFCHGPATPPPLQLTTQTTIQTPSPPCEDKLGNCAAYGADACKFYKKWAELNCGKTCGVCGSPTLPPPTPTTTTTTATAPITVTGECVDHLHKGSCEKYGPGICMQYREWAAKQCPKFCRFCEPPTSPAPSTTEPPCINKDPDCESRGPIVCFQNQTWAEQNCRQYCLFCTPSTTAQPVTSPTSPPITTPTVTRIMSTNLPTSTPSNPPTTTPAIPPTTTPSNPPITTPTIPPNTTPSNSPLTTPTIAPTTTQTIPPTTTPSNPPTTTPTNPTTAAPTVAPTTQTFPPTSMASSLSTFQPTPSTALPSSSPPLSTILLTQPPFPTTSSQNVQSTTFGPTSPSETPTNVPSTQASTIMVPITAVPTEPTTIVIGKKK